MNSHIVECLCGSVVKNEKALRPMLWFAWDQKMEEESTHELMRSESLCDDHGLGDGNDDGQHHHAIYCDMFLGLREGSSIKDAVFCRFLSLYTTAAIPGRKD
jgi:hypothetical protein